MKVALLFSPQGSQSVGMGRELASRSPAADEIFAEAVAERQRVPLPPRQDVLATVDLGAEVGRVLAGGQRAEPH